MILSYSYRGNTYNNYIGLYGRLNYCSLCLCSFPDDATITERAVGDSVNVLPHVTIF
jgi:hypothetical protein